MNNPKRKELRLIEPLDMDQLNYSSLNEAINYLMELRAKTNGEATIDIEVGATYYDDYYVKGEVQWVRMETDEEYEKRCRDHHKRAAVARKSAAKKKVQKEREERELLKKLKARYES